MATTVSNINVAMVEDRVIPALRLVLPILRAFSYVMEQDDKIKNDTTYVPAATDPTVGNKTAGTMTTAGGTIAGTLVTLNRFRSAAWDAVEGAMRGSLFESYWADKAAGAVYVLAKDVIDYALSLVTASNFGNTSSDKLAVAPADFGQSDAAELWGKAEDKIKRQEKVFMMNTAYATALFGNSNLALIYANAGSNFLESGQLPRFLGLGQMHYSGLPSNSQNLGGVILGRGAIGVALAMHSQLMSSGEGNVIDRRKIVDPDSGIGVVYTVIADGGGTVEGECSLLYGASKIQDAAVRLVTA